MHEGATDAAAIAGLVKEIALRIEHRLGRRITVSLGVDDAVTDAIAGMPSAEVHQTVYVRAERSYVIRGARVRIGLVTIECQAEARPATSDEVEAAGGWHEHHDEYRMASVRSVR
jgi:hypothetical protein